MSLDALAAVIHATADPEGAPSPDTDSTMTVLNLGDQSQIIRVQAVTPVVVGGPAEALAAAERLLAQLLAVGYTAPYRVTLSADTLGDDNPGWRGRVYVHLAAGQGG